MSWTNDVVLEFLELYRSEQLLWDPKQPLHRNRSEVANAWARIQNALSVKCSILDLKKKKESLMTSFRMHFAKKKKCEQGYRTTWFAYALMESFLGGKYECDSTNQMENELYNSTTHSSSIQPIHDHGPRNTTRESEKTTAYAVRRCLPPANAPSDPEKNDSELVYAKRKMAEAVSYLKTAVSEDKGCLKDEYELYGQLLAKKLRKLEEHQRDVAMHEIDNIMFRAKMQSGPQARSYSSSPSPLSRKVKSPVLPAVSSQILLHYEDDNNVSYEAHVQPQSPS